MGRGASTQGPGAPTNSEHFPNIFRTFSEHFAGTQPRGEARARDARGTAISEHFRTFPNISEDLRGWGEGLPPSEERHPAVPNISLTFSEHFCRNHHRGERRGRGEGEALTNSEHVPNMFRTFPTASPRRPPIPKKPHGPPNPFENRAALRQSTGRTTRKVCQMHHLPNSSDHGRSNKTTREAVLTA